MSDVFISYARSTEATARQVGEALRALGYGVWRDDELPAHQDYSKVIEERLRAAKAVVVMWSAEAIKSQWVCAEADVAREAGTLVQLNLDAAVPPLPFNRIQCADLRDWTGDLDAPGWRKVAASVADLVGAKGGAPEAKATAQGSKLSICVLPFANMSGDAEQEYFSDGITEDIITDLSKVSALSVVSRNSAFQFKGKHVDLRQVARQLEVSHVLEGSVRKAGNRVRITAQLIEGAGDSHIWAERYDRDLTDIFAVQDEISQAIVAALKLKLLPEEKAAITQRGTASVQAYDLYLMARQISIGDNADLRGHETMVRLCRRAIEIDSNYAQAWALMALAQTTLHMRYDQSESGMAAAERALAIDPDLPEAHAVRARHLAEAGSTDEANAELELALRLGPESFEVQSTAGFMCFRYRRLLDAAQHYENACALIETAIGPSAMLMSCYGGLGDTAARRRAAASTLKRAEAALILNQHHPHALTWGASALAVLGERDKARSWVSSALLVDPDSRATRYNLACALSTDLDDVAGAIDLLTPYLATASIGEIGHTEVDPDLDPLRGDARYQSLIAAAKARLGAP